MSNDRHTGEGLGLLIAGLLLVAWLTVRTIVRHPVLTLAAAASLSVYVAGGLWAVAGLWAAVALVLVAWRRIGAGSFDRSVSWRARGSWRGWWVYGRNWRSALTMCDLGDRYDGTDLVPRLRRVRSNPYIDRVSVGLLKGQKPRDLARQADTLAHTFGQLDCRVRVAGPGRATLDFTRRDLLATPVPALPIPDATDLLALPMGLREDGNLWSLRLLGRHLLVAGVTGAGKGSILQSVIRPCCPAVRSGLVRLHGIDPKGGMELGAAGARVLYHRLATDDPAEQLELLEDLVGRMRGRARRLAGVTRLHTPTVDDPLELLVIDELAALTAYKPRTREARELYGQIDMAINLLLSQGRAVGISVIAALQDPRKEVLPSRDLFPTRIALRLIEAEATDMVLGPGARDLGADCSRINPDNPGTAWVWCDGEPEPTRVRASYPTDSDIAHQAERYRPLAADAIDADVIDLASPEDDEGAAA